MGTIFVKDREGIEHKLPAEEGLTIMEIIVIVIQLEVLSHEALLIIVNTYITL